MSNWWLDETPPFPGDRESEPLTFGDAVRNLGHVYEQAMAEVGKKLAQVGQQVFLDPASGRATLSGTNLPIGVLVDIDPTTGTAKIRTT